MLNQTCSQFCKCQIFLPTRSSQQTVSSTLYISLLIILILTPVSIKISTKWFVFKDYYPFKQKSPILCLLLSVVVLLQILIYPTLFIFHYFTKNFECPDNKRFFRSLYIGLEYIPYLIYLIRAMRISYAHQIDTTRHKTIIFKIFQKQIYLVGIVVIVSLTRALPVIFDLFEHNQQHFRMLVEYNSNQNKAEYNQDYILYSLALTSWMWQLVLIYCLWVQKNVNPKYSMRGQIILLILQQLLFSIVNLIIGFKNRQNQNYVLNNLCENSQINYPNIQILKFLKLSLIYIISLVLPLFKKKIYHRLLPTGRHYGFIKTMRDFLMEQQFCRVFSKYLKHLDYLQNTDKNIRLLRFWKQLVIIKLKKVSQQDQKLSDIYDMVEEEEDYLFKQHKIIINSLKDSILTLQQPSECSQIMRVKHRESINQKVQELQKIALQKLDAIFVNRYRLTESYYSMRQITMRNKNINLNMIMLNMVLIVDSQNQYN